METFPSTSPFPPPHTEEDLLAWLRLLRSRRVGTSTFFRLMSECGDARAALDRLPGLASASGLSGYAACPVETARDEMRRGTIAGARLVAWGSSDYPPLLAAIPDPPPLLWARGRVELLRARSVAIVGARNASSLGLRMARALATGLGGAGIVTVSGLARGIDTISHQASLQTGTIAVMAGGVDVVYPSENATLAREIEETGLIVSEQPMGMQPQARHFPRRNRIISGLAGATVVVEAAAKSGSLITARDALEQGREVLAVPGHPFDARASGCNMLIRDGATLVRGPQDVLEALAQEPFERHATEPPASPPAEARIPATDDLHQLILDRLGPSPTSEDQLIRDIDRPTGIVAAEIVALELEGRILRQPGGMLSRN
ncbi:DNA-processing protein DprA [Palleronia sp. LCG004]|nr:DNA-processing protein DprA [Palleronia sp. LCG004]WOI55683.1 DNA-processing protein DprA [Palleronia sp. LCG004]